MEMTVGKLVESKGGAIITVNAGASVHEAVVRMIENKVGSVVVTDGNKVVLGIITERDVLKRVVGQSKDCGAEKVADHMTKDLLAVKPHKTLRECMAIMSRRGVRHLLVHEGDNLRGLVSVRDIISKLVGDYSVEIEELKNFIYTPY